ncbi:dihydroorotase [Myxococcota bacterium]|nr:dihydroorotase [Myxococcota bacterium]MBU1536941.1 dihydroorotase [Myxococcota bacterium]
MVIRGGNLFLGLEKGFQRHGCIRISQGKITEVSFGKQPSALAPCEIIIAPGRVELGSEIMVIPGLIDAHVHLREPGFEEKESILSGSRAALAGGFTTIFSMPNTNPPPDTPERYGFIAGLGHNAPVDVVVVGAATLGRKGQELVDYQSLHRLGATVFSDDGDPLWDPVLLRRLLKASARLGFIVSDHCEDPRLSGKFPLHEGSVAKALGLPGQPSSAETVQLAKGIALAVETGGRYHAQHLSARESIDLVRQARNLGWPVTCEVTVHHLFYTQEVIHRALGNGKCAPPLRSEEDRRALLTGCTDGTVSAIVTDHAPHLAKEKLLPLGDAPFGVIGLETALSAVHTLAKRGELAFERGIHLMTAAPASLFGLSGAGSLVAGNCADITLFNPAMEWTVEPPFYSKSQNSPFISETLQGRVAAVFKDGVLRHVLD